MDKQILIKMLEDMAVRLDMCCGIHHEKLLSREIVEEAREKIILALNYIKSEKGTN